jgi:valyl-tRNA synthetase
MAKKGEKLSKSRDNAAMSPQALISEYSADVVRLWASTGRLGTDIVFVEEELRNNQRLPIKLWNAARLVLPHLRDFRRPVDRDAYRRVVVEPMDRWLIQRACVTSNQVGAALESFEIHRARELLDSFFWNDFCDNYLEIVKERLYKPAVRGEAAKESARTTLYAVLLEILKMYSVFAPHIAEEIYQAYDREQEGCESVQLLRWGLDLAVESGRAAVGGGTVKIDRATAVGGTDEADDSAAMSRTTEAGDTTARVGTFLADDETARGGDEFVEIVSLVRQFKSEHGLSQGAEVECVTVRCPAENYEFLNAAYLDLKAVTRSRELILAVSERGDEPEQGDESEQWRQTEVEVSVE